MRECPPTFSALLLPVSVMVVGRCRGRLPKGHVLGLLLRLRLGSRNAHDKFKHAPVLREIKLRDVGLYPIQPDAFAEGTPVSGEVVAE